ncbi:MAG: hypothetical protein IAC61_03365 [Firmicutes bacterium]|uniref:Uncharacterized protein n=1 Tax=Candidatus Alloenteromonas pullistercoris TaxID=2840785 RepID=A0A9D9DGP0_9FIRM|nr:hypothetical protein [Candidatus Enteromonas pullistercoris]
MDAREDGGVSFSDLDGQSFLIVREFGIWDEVIAKKLKRSRIFRQKNMDGLQEIVSASSIPSFVTNISLRFRDDTDRVFVPITDEEATKTFYGICKKANIRLLKRIKAVN